MGEAKTVRQRVEAEASRNRGMQLVERGEYERAIEQFSRALSVAEPEWEHLAQVQVDLAALERWRTENGGPQGGTR